MLLAMANHICLCLFALFLFILIAVAIAARAQEQALVYILEDEKLEVTPKRIAMRKAILDAALRKQAEKAAAKVGL